MPPGRSTASTEGRLAESDLEGDMPIDPVLGNLQSLLFGEPSDAQEAIVRQTGLAAGHSVEIPDSCKVVSADRAAFMTFFSQVNATTAQLPAFNRRNHMPSMSGHTSRSEPPRHQWRCANARLGAEGVLKGPIQQHGIMHMHAVFALGIWGATGAYLMCVPERKAQYLKRTNLPYN